LLEEQLSVIDSSMFNVENNLIKSEALRQSILKKAFSGQLVPQDPNDEPASLLLERIAAEKAEAVAQAKKIKTAKKKAARKRS
jgi:type I restriction enzyme S subunit